MATIFSAILIGLLVPTVANAALLLLIARLFRLPHSTIGAATATAIPNPLIQLLMAAGLFTTLERSSVAASLVALAGFAALIVVPAFLIKTLFRGSWGRTLGVFLVWGLCGSLVNGGIAWGMSTFALETFYVPTNAMAPTIVGEHRVGTCPKCGGQVFVSASRGPDGRVAEPTEGICSSCWQSVPASNISAEPLPGDRFVSDKVARARRWDIVTYYPPPEQGRVLYVHRLVGLPGESVLVKQGKLWIDGVLIDPPPEISKLEYAGSKEMTAANDGDFGLEWGTEDQPCLLREDECFVLGDNTLRSVDSRFFGPVKRDRIIGVVTLCYWPSSRARFSPRPTD